MVRLWRGSYTGTGIFSPFLTAITALPPSLFSRLHVSSHLVSSHLSHVSTDILFFPVITDFFSSLSCHV